MIKLFAMLLLKLRKWSDMNKKIIITFVAVLLLAPVSWLVLYANTILENKSNSVPYPFYNDKLASQHLVAHAGGWIDNRVYTNSREAVERSIKQGRKYIEIDMIETSDGHYVAAHDWELVNKMLGKESSAPLSLNEFKNAKLYDKYTTMSVKDVAELMEKYPDWYLLTDKIRDIDYLKENLYYPDRIIVQTFGLLGYFKALKLGFKYPVLRLKGGRRGIKEIYKIFMNLGNIKGVILGEKSFNKNKDYIGKLHNNGVSVILYGNPSFKIVESATAIKELLYKYIDLVDSDTLSKL